MASTRAKVLILLVIVGLLVADSEARSRKKSKAQRKRILERQMVLQKRETNSINFSRLVAMRVIYGIASMLGVQDRLSGILNGAFVPPGADDDDYGLDLDDDGDDGVDLGDYFDA